MHQYWAGQSHFDELHHQLVEGSISRNDYTKAINDSWSDIDPKYKPSLQRRKDRRTLGVFALQVHDNTVREKFLVTQWIKSLGRELELVDNASYNNGRLVLDPADTDKADFWVKSVKGDWALELKFNPCSWKMTFKVCDLKNYARQNAVILLIIGDTSMIGPNGDPASSKPLELPAGLKWCLINRETIRWTLKEIPVKPHREVGFKPSIQLRIPEIRRYLKIRDWDYNDGTFKMGDELVG